MNILFTYNRPIFGKQSLKNPIATIHSEHIYKNHMHKILFYYVVMLELISEICLIHRVWKKQKKNKYRYHIYTENIEIQKYAIKFFGTIFLYNISFGRTFKIDFVHDNIAA